MIPVDLWGTTMSADDAFVVLYRHLGHEPNQYVREALIVALRALLREIDLREAATGHGRF